MSHLPLVSSRNVRACAIHGGAAAAVLFATWLAFHIQVPYGIGSFLTLVAVMTAMSFKPRTMAGPEWLSNAAGLLGVFLCPCLAVHAAVVTQSWLCMIGIAASVVIVGTYRWRNDAMQLG